MTRSPSFPSDRWRGPTIKQEQKSLSQPKPCRVVLIVCSGAVGIAYLIAAITNCLYRDRRDLLWTFREWFVLRRFLGERTMGRDRESRNEERRQFIESEQIGSSPLERALSSRRCSSTWLMLSWLTIYSRPATACGWHCQCDTLQRSVPMVPTFCVCVRQRTHSKR